MFVLLLNHPFELAIPIALSTIVIQTMFDGSDGIDRRLDDHLGAWLSTIWQLGTLLGSAAIVAGVLLRPRATGVSAARLSRLRILERTGCLAVATVCAVYSVVVVAADQLDGLSAAVTMAAVSAGFALRSLALGQVDKAVLSGLRMLNNHTD